MRFNQISGFAYTTGDEKVTPDLPLQMTPLGPARPIKDFFHARRLGYVYDDTKFPSGDDDDDDDFMGDDDGSDD